MIQTATPVIATSAPSTKNPYMDLNSWLHWWKGQKVKKLKVRDWLLLAADFHNHSSNSSSSSDESNSSSSEHMRSKRKKLKKCMKRQKWERKPPSAKALWKREARTVENLNDASSKEQTNPAIHSMECRDVLVLLVTHHKGEVITACSLIDLGCAQSIVLKNCVEKNILKRAGWLRNPIEYQTYMEDCSKLGKQRGWTFCSQNTLTSRKI